MKINPAYLDESKTNHYGEKVAASVVRRIYDGAIDYRCRDDQWSKAHEEWCKARRDGDKAAPCPMSEGHSLFVRPLDYGCVPVDCEDSKMIRRALRHSILARLDGWDRDLRKTPEGMRKLAKIVRASVNARLGGSELGGAPYVACIFAGI